MSSPLAQQVDNPPSPTPAAEPARAGLPLDASPGASRTRGLRLRAYMEFIFAILYFFLAREVARRGASTLATDQWFPLVSQAMLACLLIAGYGTMGIVFDRQPNPFAAQGWPMRRGWPRETGLGLSVGWALAVLCVLPLTLIGGIAIRFAVSRYAWGWLVADVAFFGLLALAEEVAFRGYGFQRFTLALGRTGALLSFAFFYAILQALVPGSSSASFAASFALSLLLSTAYLRTRALWVSWGINFGWKASRALLFGLAISGNGSHSPVVQGDPMGPFWLTGGGFGLDGTWLTFFILLAALPLVYRITRDLDFQHNAPVIVPGGIPVDIDAAARRQHEAAMGTAVETGDPAPPVLVQIAPAASGAPQTSHPERPESGAGNDSL
ncbi:MAG: CPBP family glutamic-type intramembrane protease [Terracidiphilus sp.]